MAPVTEPLRRHGGEGVFAQNSDYAGLNNRNPNGNALEKPPMRDGQEPVFFTPPILLDRARESSKHLIEMRFIPQAG